MAVTKPPPMPRSPTATTAQPDFAAAAVCFVPVAGAVPDDVLAVARVLWGDVERGGPV